MLIELELTRETKDFIKVAIQEQLMDISTSLIEIEKAINSLDGELTQIRSILKG